MAMHAIQLSTGTDLKATCLAVEVFVGIWVLLEHVGVQFKREPVAAAKKRWPCRV